MTLVRFFKALADESRLKILGLLASGERSVDELASLLALRPPTVSHHLSRLRDLGLVNMRPAGNTHYYRLDAQTLRDMSRDVLTPPRMRALVDDVEAQAWERKVLHDFFDDGRLREIPSAQKKRRVVLRWLAERFDPGVAYAQEQVNEILGRYHADVAYLRREMVGFGLLDRTGRTYRRPADPNE